MSVRARLNWPFLRAWLVQRAPEAMDLVAAVLCGLALYGAFYAFLAGRWGFGLGFAFVAITAVTDCIREVTRAIARSLDDGTSEDLPDEFDA